MIRTLWIGVAALLLMLCTSYTHAQNVTLRQGLQAPAAQVQLLRRSAPLKIGRTSVWPLPNAAPLDADGKAQPNSTLVVRTSDWLIGLSTNDLVVIYSDTAAISLAATGLAKQVHAFPQQGITVLHVSAFSDLLPLYQTLSGRFPMASFSVPVSYAKLRAN